MKLAVVDGHRLEAAPGISAACQACGSPVIAKCGEIRIWHWAHQTKQGCDAWWENEGEWHRAWKNRFSISWQEIVHSDERGTKHIADVRTDRGWVIEFQHSHISPDERRSRSAFYKRLVWVVDATRRKTDSSQFAKALETGSPVAGNHYIRRVLTDKCRLLSEWRGSAAPVFFDFGDEQTLWWFIAKEPEGTAYVGLTHRAAFIESHHGKGPESARDFDQFVTTHNELVALSEEFIRSAALGRFAPPVTRLYQRGARHRARRRL